LFRSPWFCRWWPHAVSTTRCKAYGTGDYAKALAEFRVLADQGKPEAQYSWLVLHNGFGVPRDQNESARWFLKAARQGDARSQYYVGIMAEKGQGVEKGPGGRAHGLSLSASNPQTSLATRSTPGKRSRSSKKKMTPEQVARAKETAKNWNPQN